MRKRSQESATLIEIGEGESLREIADALGWRINGDDWLETPEERRARWEKHFANHAKIDAQAEARRRRKVRKLERERIKEMEKLGYEFTDFGWDGRMNFRPRKAEAERSEQAAEITPLDAWRARHAR